MKQATLVVVIYDGIDNSVFDSQVMQPLAKRLQENPEQQIVLVSFEKKQPTSKAIHRKIPNHESLKFIVRKKISYIGTPTLYFAAYALKKILKNIPRYDLLARGPLAGFICQKAYSPSSCNSLTIQARGLLAEEYTFEQSTQRNPFAALWHHFRYRQFYKLESITYSKTQTNTTFPSIIQSVSKALGEYLITAYDADRTKITIATHDIPTSIEPVQSKAWKEQTRKELNISSDALVYCYNGSIKPWQCPEQIINYFKEKYLQNSCAILLILTQDTESFQALINKHTLTSDTYRLLSVSHDAIYQYLAAADVGLMFREPHIVNWVSRPTKALEYACVGLAIEHNNTVSWLREQSQNISFPKEESTTNHILQGIYMSCDKIELNPII